MRWVTAALMIALILGCASAQEPVYLEANSVIEWDGYELNPANSELLPGDTVAYEVYLWDYSQGDPAQQPIEALTYYRTVSPPRAELDFERRARWAIAVRVVVTDGGGNSTYSEFAYTTVASDTAGGMAFVVVPATVWVVEPVQGLRLAESVQLIE